MGIKYGTNGTDMFTTGANSQTIYGRAGADHFEIPVEDFRPHTVLSLYGQDGQDYFSVEGLTRETLETVDRQQINIYGGNGYDQADLSFYAMAQSR